MCNNPVNIQNIYSQNSTMSYLQEMLVFAKVVEMQGFSAAARELHQTTSAVSRQVQRLEAHLGARLLNRTTRRLSTTEFGQQVYAACSRLAEQAREIESLGQSYGHKPQGKLRISAPVVFGQLWLAPRLHAFMQRYPELQLELSLVDRMVDLIDEGFDLTLRISRELAPGLVSRPLMTMRYILVASKHYLQEHTLPHHPRDLTAHKAIIYGYHEFNNHLSLSHASGESLNLSIPSMLTINNSIAMLAAVQAGAGIGLLPAFVAAQALAHGEIIEILPDWQFQDNYQTRQIVAAWLPTRHLPLKTRVFIDYLLEHIEPS